MFAIAAFRFGWRHGDDAQLTTPQQSTDFPAPVEEASVAVLEAPAPPEARSSDKLTLESAPFYIQSGREVRYKGASGGEARRCIEALRASGAPWEAYRNGALWDSSPQ